MTDQRERVSTDPGIGPVDGDNTATLRSIEAAVEIEPDGASLYYEPLPLAAPSDHRTLEIETVKLSQAIDPRKAATEINLPRSPLPPRSDSGWPQAELVHTSSQRPAPSPRRWRVPALLLGVLFAVLALLLVRSVAQRDADHAASVNAQALTASLPASKPDVILAVSAPLPVGKPTPFVIASAPLPVTNPTALAPTPVVAVRAAPASVAPNSVVPMHAAPTSVTPTSVTPIPAVARTSPALATHVAAPVATHSPSTPKPSAEPAASSSATSAAPVKPKRAIY